MAKGLGGKSLQVEFHHCVFLLSHGLRNEMRIRLKWLHRPVRSPRFLNTGQKSLSLVKTGEQ